MPIYMISCDVMFMSPRVPDADSSRWELANLVAKSDSSFLMVADGDVSCFKSKLNPSCFVVAIDSLLPIWPQVREDSALRGQF